MSQQIKKNRDQASALSALVEGDATLAEIQYALEQLSASDLLEALSQDVSTSVLDSVPNIVRRSLVFPYIEGLSFVQGLYGGGSWETVNDAFLDPPTSTEQVLHPTLYLGDHVPQSVTLPTFQALLDSGWEIMDENTLGEFFLRVFLDEEVSTQQAVDAAAGWGGDRYKLFTDSQGRRALALVTTWDTRKDTGEFSQAFERYSAQAFGLDVVVHSAQKTTQVNIAIAPDKETLDLIIEGFSEPF